MLTLRERQHLSRLALTSCTSDVRLERVTLDCPSTLRSQVGTSFSGRLLTVITRSRVRTMPNPVRWLQQSMIYSPVTLTCICTPALLLLLPS